MAFRAGGFSRSSGPSICRAPPPEPRTSSRTALLPRELERILKCADSDVILNSERTVVLDAIELGFTTGMRLQALCSRTWGDLSAERNAVRVDDQPACDFTPKNDPSRRTIPLWPRAQMVIERRQELRISEDPAEPVLLAPRHAKSGNLFVSYDWVSRCFTEYRKATGVPEGTFFHSLRHTYITYCLALGIAESKVMSMSGHVKSSTMLRYTHMVEELLQVAPDEALLVSPPGKD